MKIRFFLSVVLNTVITSILANGFVGMQKAPQSLYLAIPVFILLNLLAGVFAGPNCGKPLTVCRHGTVLLYSFCLAFVVSAVYQTLLGIRTLPHNTATFVWSLLVCIGVLFTVFWNGMLCVYFTSTQLRVKWRLLGVIFGLIPVINLIILFVILTKTTGECFFEHRKHKINQQRKDQKLCATQYPILLVHGVFFRDYKFFNYWGRIPAELERNGATVFYGNHSSAAAVEKSAAEIKERIQEVLAQTGAEKVNIIAHSKGGLDCRYALSHLGVEEWVASLTTVNTPHNGCLFADYLLTKISQEIKRKIAGTYNAALKKLGEENPDFLAAVEDLTDKRCRERNRTLTTPRGVFCQSIGSVMKGSRHGRFPLNFSYYLVKHFDGENDGLVSEASFEWGEKYTLLRPTGKRGISHGDMIDLNRENVKDFDVREFYVNLVKDLKQRGL